MTANGQPDMMVDSIPPFRCGEIKITRPEIYFGELTNNYILVNTDEEEFDYTAAGKRIFTTYKGEAESS